MKILFTGGGTGGHFYPIIAVAEEVNKISEVEKILETRLYFMSDSPYDKGALFENGITFVGTPAGKMRTYFSLANFFDLFKTFFGLIGALIKMYQIYPDVVFAKGGYASFPALFAAKILGIPVMIHESDSAPGRVNVWASKFALRVAVSFEEAGSYFPKEKTAWIGQPIRQAIRFPAKEGAYEYLRLDPSVPVILVLGGSQGSEIINNAVLDILPSLLERYQVIHQTGEKNFEDVSGRAKAILKGHANSERYKPFAFLNPLALKMCGGAANLAISRAGSTIFELASWGLPSVIIPITNSNADHQRKNAFNYARTGSCQVIEEANLTSHVLLAQIDNLFADKARMEKMKKAATTFAKPDAAEKIARELITVALEHYK